MVLPAAAARVGVDRPRAAPGRAAAASAGAQAAAAALRRAEGLRATPALEARRDALEARCAALPPELAAAPAALPLALHPNLAAIYRARVARLAEALAAGQDPAALEAARALIEQVVVHPPQDGGPPGLELEGGLAAMLREAGIAPARAGRGQADVGMFERSVKAAQGGQRPPGGEARRGSAPPP